MIDSTDMESIDKEHFKIVEKKEYTIVLRSKNTGHYWCLLEQEYNNHRTFRISHRHKESAPYHFQRNKPTVAECCDYIKNHDVFQLAKEHEKEERRRIRLANKDKKNTLPR